MIVGDATVLIRAVESPDAQRNIANVGRKVEAEMGRSGERAGRQFANGFDRATANLARRLNRSLSPVRRMLADIGRRSVDTLAYLAGARFLAERTREIMDFLTSIDRMLPKFAFMSTGITGLVGAVGGLILQVFTMLGDLQTVPALLAPLPGLIMGAVVAVGLLVVALQDAKTELAPLKDEMSALADTISGNFWSEARAPIIEMVETLFPALNEALGRSSAAMGRWVAAFAEGIQNNFTPDVIEEIFGAFEEGFDILSGGGDAFAGILASFALIASDYFPAISMWLRDITIQFDNWLNTIRGDGTLDRWIQDAQTQLGHLWRGLVNLGGVFAGITNAARNAGFEGMAMFEETMARWNAAINSPEVQAQLSAIFEGFRFALDSVTNALADAVSGLLSQADQINLTFFWVGLAIEEIGRALETLFSNSDLATAITGMFQDFTTALQNIQPAIDPLATKLGAIASFVGDMAVAFSGPFAALLIALEEPFGRVMDALTVIVNTLAPELQRIFESDEFASIIESVADAIERFAEIVQDRMPELRPIIDMILEAAANVARELPNLIDALDPLIDLLILLGPVIQAVLNGITMLAIGFTASLRTIIVIVGAAIDFLQTSVSTITMLIGAVAAAASRAMQGDIAGAAAIMDEAMRMAGESATGAVQRWDEAMGEVSTIGGEAALSLIQSFGTQMGLDQSMVDSIVQNFSPEQMGELRNILMTQGVEAAGEYARGILDGVETSVAPATVEFRERVRNTVGETPAILGGIGTDSALKMAAGLKSKQADVDAAAKGLRTGAKINTDPSVTDLSNTGTLAGQKMADGLASKTGATNTAANALRSNAKNGVSALTGEFSSTGSGAGQKMADGIGSKAGAVGGQAAGLVSAAKKNMSGAYSGGYSAGSQLGEGLKIGIRAKIGAVAREAAKMVYSATAAAKNAAKTASPSRLWRDEIGMQLSAGAAIGIARGSRDVAEAARNAIPHVTIPAVLTPVSLTGGGGGSLSAAMSDGSLAMNRQIGGQSSVLNRAGDRVQMPVSIKIEGYDKDPLELAREVAREMKGILSFDMNNGSIT